MKRSPSRGIAPLVNYRFGWRLRQLRFCVTQRSASRLKRTADVGSLDFKPPRRISGGAAFCSLVSVRSRIPIILLAVLCACETRTEPKKSEVIIPAARGSVSWLDSEDSSTWTESDRPFLLFLHAERSPWSRLMIQDVFTDQEVAWEIGRITRPVWVDADLRPDLVDRFGLGSIPGLAVLTRDLTWITGSGFMGREDVVDLLRRIRILHDIPERRTGLERERAKLLRRRPIPSGAWAKTATRSSILSRLSEAVDAADHPSIEARLWLVERGASDGGAWADAIRNGMEAADGPIVDGGLDDLGIERDPTVSLARNAGILYGLAGIAAHNQSEELASVAGQLYLAVTERLYDEASGLFLAGDVSSADSRGTTYRVDLRTPTAENALMVSAICLLGTVRPNKEARVVGLAVLDRLIASRLVNDTVVRVDSIRSAPQIADAAHLARACLDAASAFGDDRYRQTAQEIVSRLTASLDWTDAAANPWEGFHPIGADDLYGSGIGVIGQVLVRLRDAGGEETTGKLADQICREAVVREPERLGRLGSVGRALDGLGKE